MNKISTFAILSMTMFQLSNLAQAATFDMKTSKLTVKDSVGKSVAVNVEELSSLSSGSLANYWNYSNVFMSSAYSAKDIVSDLRFRSYSFALGMALQVIGEKNNSAPNSWVALNFEDKAGSGIANLNPIYNIVKKAPDAPMLNQFVKDFGLSSTLISASNAVIDQAYLSNLLIAKKLGILRIQNYDFKCKSTGYFSTCEYVKRAGDVSYKLISGWSKFLKDSVQI